MPKEKNKGKVGKNVALHATRLNKPYQRTTPSPPARKEAAKKNTVEVHLKKKWTPNSINKESIHKESVDSPAYDSN